MSSDELVGRFSIGDLIKAGVISAHKDGNFGSLYPRLEDFGKNGLPLLTAKVVNAGRIDFGAAQKLRKEKAACLPYGFIQAGDVLLSHNATVGRVAVVPEFSGQALIGTSLTYFRLDASRLLPRYLAGFFESRDFQNQLAGVMGLSTRNQVPITAQRLLEVEVPPLKVQHRISEFIGALDDRIALLRETNATLEDIAQALFKSWFVDFGPVRAKSQGLAPAGMDEVTSALFSDGFEETRRGPVPRGWREASIYDVAQVVYGAPFASSRFNTDGSGRPLVRIRDLRDEAPGVHTDEVHPKGYLLTPGDIVVGMDGEFRAYLWGGEQAWLNQRVCVFQPKAGVPAAFVRASIEPQLAHIEATETATTVIHLGKGDIDRFVALVPPDDILAAFGAIADPLYARFVANKQTCRSLAALRDTLLPRLISGQLRLPEASAEAEEVV